MAARLNAALDRESDSPITWPQDLPRRELPADGAELLQWIRDQSPELARSASELERDEQRARLSELTRRPDFTLGLEWIDTGPARAAGVPDSGKDPWVASVSVNLPIWNERSDATREEARARRRAASMAREQAVRELESAVEDGLYRLREAERRIELYSETLLPGARQSYSAEEAAFSSGQTRFSDLLDAERTLLEFELALERARSDRARAFSQLERLAGRPFPPPDADQATDRSQS